MFSFQFGTFESSTPGWFDGLSLLLTLIVSAVSIYYAYKLADKSFKKAQGAKEEDEKKLYENEMNLLKKSLRDLLSPIEGTIEAINKTIEKNLSHLNIHLELNASFLKLINLNRIFHYEKDKIVQLNDVILYLNKIDSLNDYIERDTKTFINDFNSLHHEYIRLIFELELKYFNLVALKNYNPMTYTIMSSTFDPALHYVHKFANLRNKYISINFMGNDLIKEIAIEYIRKLEEISISETFREANEIKLLCSSIKRQLLDIKNIEVGQINSLKRYIKILNRSKTIFDSYIN